MGTHAVTKVVDETGDVYVAMYSQYDGYPSHLGKDLYSFLKDLEVVNGLSYNEQRRVANGPGCLAAQLVVGFKQAPGGFYLQPASYDEYEWYNYTIVVNQTTNTIEVRVQNHDGNVMFSGDVEHFGGFCMND